MRHTYFKKITSSMHVMVGKKKEEIMFNECLYM